MELTGRQGAPVEAGLRMHLVLSHSGGFKVGPGRASADLSGALLFTYSIIYTIELNSNYSNTYEIANTHNTEEQQTK